MTAPSTMRAAIQLAPAQPLRIDHLPMPAPRTGAVRVRVHAAGLNPLDAKIRAGAAPHAQQPLPAVLGIDMAGIVEEVGAGVAEFAPGDEVFGMVGGVGAIPGTLSEWVSVDAALLAHKPRALSMKEAAALPLVFITAWEGLVDRAKLAAGSSVLVHGGAGGVGHVAIQIARSRGAKVHATGTADQRAFIESLGATHIDYQQEPVESYVQRLTGGEGFDVIFDTVGGATLDASFRAARRYHGHVVSALGWGTHALAPLSFRAATYSGVFTLLPLQTGLHRAHHGWILRHAAALADAGRLRPRVEARDFTLDEAEQAFRLLEEGGAVGKVVVSLV